MNLHNTFGQQQLNTYLHGLPIPDLDAQSGALRIARRLRRRHWQRLGLRGLVACAVTATALWLPLPKHATTVNWRAPAGIESVRNAQDQQRWQRTISPPDAPPDSAPIWI